MSHEIHNILHKEIARELGIEESVIEKICRSQFEYVTQVMKEGKNHSVRLKYLGIFGVKKKREEHLNAKKAQGQKSTSENKGE